MLQRIALTIALVAAVLTSTGCRDNLFAPQTQFWGVVRDVSQYKKHVWITTGTGTIMDVTMNPGDTWQGYLNGSQLYTVHWSFPDGSNQGQGDFRPNNIAGDAGYSNNKMDWYVEINDGGISSLQP